MAALNEDTKAYIVTALANFDSPKQVIADVREKFGVVVTSQQVSAYDPASQNGKRLSAKLKELFEDARAKAKKDVAVVPMSHMPVRLRALDRLARKAVESGNAMMAATLMEQIAKEVGGVFTNRREYSGPNGGAIPVAGIALSPEEREAALQRVLAEF